MCSVLRAPEAEVENKPAQRGEGHQVDVRGILFKYMGIYIYTCIYTICEL